MILNTTLGVCVEDYNQEYQFESIEFVDLMETLESRYGIEIPIGDVRESNFNSVNKICLYIKRWMDQKR